MAHQMKIFLLMRLFKQISKVRYMCSLKPKLELA